MKNPLLQPKAKHTHKEAYCLIKYKGHGKTETVWNNRDGVVPIIIYAKDGLQMLTRIGEHEEVSNRKHILKLGDLYFANITKARAKFLAKKIVYGRWKHPKYPLCKQHENKKEAIFMIYKSMYGDGTMFTLLKYGKDETTYMVKQFRNFIGS